MKRLMLILLLITLPFQVSWAAVGAYCQSEQATTAQHFGHHAHNNDAGQIKSLADVKVDGQKSPVNMDECGFCHLSCAKFVTAMPSVSVPLRNAAEFPASASRIYLSPVLSPAEDPDWTLAA